MYCAWRFGGIGPADRWRRVAPSPELEEFWPSRVEAFVMACEVHAGMLERTLVDIAEAFAKRGDSSSGWSKD